MKKKILLLVAIILIGFCVSLFFQIRRWSRTPYGKLDPKVALFLKISSLQGGSSYHTELSVAENRKLLDRTISLVSASPAALPVVKDITIPGPGGPIPARLYSPAGGPYPVLLYFHGGGFVVGGLYSHDSLCRTLAKKTGAIVISVDYRLAPEHPFPAAIDDAYAALLYVRRAGAEFNGDPGRIAVAGDSAGGTLAAAVSQMARDRRGPAISYQVLIYPATDASGTMTQSRRNFSGGYMLTGGDMDTFISLYLPDKKDRLNPYASPLLARGLGGLPPALVITAQFDVLRDEGEAYARKLQSAGVPAKIRRYDGVIHGFVSATRFLGQADDAIDTIAKSLRDAFNPAHK